ncbi:MAG TPA: coenzyme F420-0:L-glutamate ligase [Actinomycetes bacterium]
MSGSLTGPPPDGPRPGDQRAGVVSVVPLPGLPEVRPGDDLARLLLDGVAAAGERLRDGDVVAVTSKVVAKAEGRLVPLPPDPAGRERVRRETVAAETVRVVARRGPLVIAETRHGLVGANALIDASNAGGDALVPLPADPDASAARIRAALAEATGADVAVVVTDTLGRPWRLGQTDVAVGLAGMGALADYRGLEDGDGRVLEVTEMAVPDEVAAAADLVKGKLARVPAALLRGVARPPGDGRASDLVRPAADDLFRGAGAPEELLAFLEAAAPVALLPDPVDPALVERAVEAAAKATPGAPPALVRVGSAAARERWLAADRPGDGRDALLALAPVLLVPCLEGRGSGGLESEAATDVAGGYPQPSGSPPVDKGSGGLESEAATDVPGGRLEPSGSPPVDKDATGGPRWLDAGAFAHALALALRAQGLAAAWVPTAPSRRRAAAGSLDLPAGWLPLGALAAGHPDPAATPPPRAGQPPAVVDR